MKKQISAYLSWATVVLVLAGCGTDGGSSDKQSGNPPQSTGSTNTGGSTGSESGGDTSGSGGSTGTGAGTDPGSGGSTGTGTDTGSGTGGYPNKISVNLPFPCPGDQTGFVGCWVSEYCGTDAAGTTSYRNILWFDTGGTALKTIFVRWGVAGCPSADQPSSVETNAQQPAYVIGAEVETNAVGIVGHLLDIDQGKTKTVIGDIPQLQQFGVQRMCFPEGDYDPRAGISTTATRAASGPYVIDNTVCLQRHLTNPAP